MTRQEQQFHPSARWHLARPQSCRDDAAFVQHQQIPSPQVLTHLAKDTVLQRAIATVHHQQPRGIAGLDRRLCDQFRGQIVIELGCFQRRYTSLYLGQRSSIAGMAGKGACGSFWYQ